MIKFVYKVLPAFVFYNDKLVPEGYGGVTRFNFVFLREKYKDRDEGILQHELTHVKQLYRSFLLFPYLYLLSKKFRLKSEVKAYKVQASYYQNKEASYQWMARAIATKYKLDVTSDEAYKLLTS